MKNLLLVAFLIFGITVNAQLFVTPTATEASFVYVNDTYVYVENDVELVTNKNAVSENGTANILLRNNAQLLQGEGTDKLNKGTGEISIYQEGTVNNFDYNVWGSPVGLARIEGSGNVGGARPDGNTPFAFKGTETDQVFFVPTSVRNSNPAFATPSYDGNTSGIQGTSSSMLNIASYWLWSYQSGSDYGAWNHINNFADLATGYGFTMKGVSGTDTNEISSEIGQLQNNPGNSQRYDFRGRANNGDVIIEVGPDTETLAGNPYPSALDLSYFLIENSETIDGSTSVPACDGLDTITRNDVTNGIAYFWESDPAALSHYLVDYKGGYGAFSPLGMVCDEGMYVPATYFNFDETGESTTSDGTGNNYERRFSPVGQGFFLRGSASQSTAATGDDVTFRNEHRVFIQEGAANLSQFRNNNNNTSSSDNSSLPIKVEGVNHTYEDISNFNSGIAKIKVAIGVNDTYTRTLGIALANHATEGFDAAMDAQSITNISTDIGFKIGDRNNYIINAVPKDEYQWIPLSFRMGDNTELRLKVSSLINFEYDNIFFLDSLTGEYRTILNEEVLMVLEEGVYEDRFFIRFTRADQAPEDTEEEEEETTEEEETEEEETTEEETTEEETIEISVNEQNPFIDKSVLESFTILQNNNNGQLEIYNPENIVVNNVSLFDLTGKQIFNEVDLGGQLEYTFPTRNLATGIYVVKFVTRDGLTKGRKISVVN